MMIQKSHDSTSDSFGWHTSGLQLEWIKGEMRNKKKRKNSKKARQMTSPIWF